MSIQSDTEKLVESICRSPEFKTFAASRNRIASNPQLFNMVNEYLEKRKRYMSNKKMTQNILSALNKLDQQNKALLSKPEIKEFLRASQSFYAMFGNVMNLINKYIDARMGGSK